MRRTALILFSCVLVGVALFPALSSAERPQALQRRAGVPSVGVVSHRVTQTGAEVRGYWTPERMRKARPVEIILDRSDRVPVSDIPASTGPEIDIEPTEAEGAGLIIPFDRVEITNTADVPFRTHGKVFFSSGGDDYVCSGTVVTSAGENLVVTAGHCVYDAGEYSTNFLFHPGFRTGSSPFGSWTASELFTTDHYAESGWANENYTYDVGMALMQPKSGETLQDSVGARGIVFNQDPSDHTYEAFGYPAENPFGGGKMYRCTSEIGARDGGGAVAPMAMGCDMTGGSSGGGWVIDEGQVNSVVSYGYKFLPEVLYGPYFGDAIETLYEEVTGDEPDPDPSPTPTPTPEQPVDHEIGLSLSMKRHLRATGRMSVPDGFLPCRRGAPIEIYRLTTSGASRFVGETLTGDDGRFGIKIKDRAGQYYAFGPAGMVGELDLCLDAYSFTVGHRH